MTKGESSVNINDIFVRLSYLSKHKELNELLQTLSDDIDVNYRDPYSGSTALVECVRGCTQIKADTQSDASGTSKGLPTNTASSPDDCVVCVRLFVKSGANVNALGKGGLSALHWAVRGGSVRLTEVLMELGADVEVVSREGHTAIQTAIKEQHIDCLELLLGAKPGQGLVNHENVHGTYPLTYAVRLGYLDVCRYLIKQGARVNIQERQKFNRTPLHYAIHLQNLPIFLLLLSYGGRVDIPDKSHKCVIHKAATLRDSRFLSAIFSVKMEVSPTTVTNPPTDNTQPDTSLTDNPDLTDIPNEDGATALMLACQRENVENVRLLLDRKVCVTSKDYTGKTALHYSVENVDVDIARKLLDVDRSLLDFKDNEGYTALQLAVIANNATFIKFLLKQGADINTVDNDGHTVAHWATVCGHADLIDLLQVEGAALSVADSHLAYPLHYAAQMCGASGEGADPKLGLEILNKLLSKKVAVDCVDKDQRTPLHWAASSGSNEACEALIKAGAAVETGDKDGLTALHCASSRGHDKCVGVLVKRGAAVDSADKNGCSPLFYAITLGHLDCAKVLMTKKADASLRDKRGRSPAHCAAAKGSIEGLRILQQKNGNLWLRNAKGECPIHEAALAKQNATVVWLLQNEPNKKCVNVGNKDKRTCLHIAALTNNLQLCKILVDYGAAKNACMLNKGQKLTPYDAATLKKNDPCSKYLSKVGAKSVTERTKIDEEEEIDDTFTDEDEKQDSVKEDEDSKEDDKKNKDKKKKRAVEKKAVDDGEEGDDDDEVETKTKEDDVDEDTGDEGESEGEAPVITEEKPEVEEDENGEAVVVLAAKSTETRRSPTKKKKSSAGRKRSSSRKRKGSGKSNGGESDTASVTSKGKRKSKSKSRENSTTRKGEESDSEVETTATGQKVKKRKKSKTRKGSAKKGEVESESEVETTATGEKVKKRKKSKTRKGNAKKDVVESESEVETTATGEKVKKRKKSKTRKGSATKNGKDSGSDDDTAPSVSAKKRNKSTSRKTNASDSEDDDDDGHVTSRSRSKTRKGVKTAGTKQASEKSSGKKGKQVRDSDAERSKSVGRSRSKSTSRKKKTSAKKDRSKSATRAAEESSGSDEDVSGDEAGPVIIAASSGKAEPKRKTGGKKKKNGNDSEPLARSRSASASRNRSESSKRARSRSKKRSASQNTATRKTTQDSGQQNANYSSTKTEHKGTPKSTKPKRTASRSQSRQRKPTDSDKQTEAKRNASRSQSRQRKPTDSDKQTEAKRNASRSQSRQRKPTDSDKQTEAKRNASRSQSRQRKPTDSEKQTEAKRNASRSQSRQRKPTDSDKKREAMGMSRSESQQRQPTSNKAVSQQKKSPTKNRVVVEAEARKKTEKVAKEEAASSSSSEEDDQYYIQFDDDGNESRVPVVQSSQGSKQNKKTNKVRDRSKSPAKKNSARQKTRSRSPSPNKALKGSTHPRTSSPDKTKSRDRSRSVSPAKGNIRPRSKSPQKTGTGRNKTQADKQHVSNAWGDVEKEQKEKEEVYHESKTSSTHSSPERSSDETRSQRKERWADKSSKPRNDGTDGDGTSPRPYTMATSRDENRDKHTHTEHRPKTMPNPDLNPVTKSRCMSRDRPNTRHPSEQQKTKEKRVKTIYNTESPILEGMRHAKQLEHKQLQRSKTTMDDSQPKKLSKENVKKKEVQESIYGSRFDQMTRFTQAKGQKTSKNETKKDTPKTLPLSPQRQTQNKHQSSPQTTQNSAKPSPIHSQKTQFKTTSSNRTDADQTKEYVKEDSFVPAKDPQRTSKDNTAAGRTKEDDNKKLPAIPTKQWPSKPAKTPQKTSPKSQQPTQNKHKGKLEENMKLGHNRYRNEIQEWVRVFEMKKLAVIEMQQAKRMQMQNNFQGGLSQRTMAGLLKDDFNERALPNLKVKRGNFDDLGSFTNYLQANLQQAHKDEQELKTRKHKPDPMELEEIMYYTRPPPKSQNSLTGKGQNSRDDIHQDSPRSNRVSKDEKRIKVKEDDEKRKLEKAYKIFSPAELFKGTPSQSNSLSKRSPKGPNHHTHRSQDRRSPSPDRSNTGSALPRITPNKPVQHTSKTPRSYSAEKQQPASPHHNASYPRGIDAMKRSEQMAGSNNVVAIDDGSVGDISVTSSSAHHQGSFLPRINETGNSKVSSWNERYKEMESKRSPRRPLVFVDVGVYEQELRARRTREAAFRRQFLLISDKERSMQTHRNNVFANTTDKTQDNVQENNASSRSDSAFIYVQ